MAAQNALELKEREAVRGEDLPMDPVDPRDRHGEGLEFRAAIDELKKLPPLLQEVVVMNSQVYRQQDVADLMGARGGPAEVAIERGRPATGSHEVRQFDRAVVA